MMSATILIRMRMETQKFAEAVQKTTKALGDLARLFEDRDRWFAVTEGEWPDKFSLLNRFIRTGQRPPYIFND